MKSYRVTLREQKNKSGRTSLYLDIYPPIYDEKKKKETRRKFLDLSGVSTFVECLPLLRQILLARKIKFELWQRRMKMILKF